MVTVEDLHRLTKEFFARHWRPEEALEFATGWSEPWYFEGTIPNHDLQGVYALIRNDEVIYVGSGASRNHGAYSGNGLGARLHSYWEVDRQAAKEAHSPRKYRYKGKLSEAPQAIVTIGLRQPFGYLAPSLEAYLIIELRPVHNSVRIGTVD